MTPELKQYYADRRLVWRNTSLIAVASVGHAACFTVVTPLMQLQMKQSGIGEKGIGFINSLNFWAVAFLVMYFAWKSDHFVSRWGRRVPFLAFSAPFIILSVVLFPLFATPWILVMLMLVQLFFMDMKASTFPLLNIDCIPRATLARFTSVISIATGIVGFLAVRYGMRLSDYSHAMPFFICAGILTVTTFFASLGIREPPVSNPTTESFRPWSTMKIGWRDRRMIVLMLAVGLINGFMVMYSQWLWLFAAGKLGLSRSDCGNAISWSLLISVALAYPIGWFIDRCGSYLLVTVFWLMQVALFLIVWNVQTANGLVLLALTAAATTPLYVGADMMVWKSAPPEHVGSITSTNSFLRNLIVGCSMVISGVLIESGGGGNFRLAFILGIALSTAGLGMMFIYRHLTYAERQPAGPAALELERV